MATLNINLPDFIIIGANKAGTTSLANYLNQHPDIKISDVKEPMFFTSMPWMRSATRENANLNENYFSLTLNEYSSLFTCENVQNKILGEASTAYLACPFQSAPWMKKIVPNIKIIAILRNPIDRAISCYKMYVGNNLEERAFSLIADNAINELQVLKGGHGGKEYIRSGLYSQLLKPYYEIFERKQILVLSYDEFVCEPSTVMKKIHTFLKVKNFDVDMSKKYNTSTENMKHKNINITNEDIKKLKIAFYNEINALQHLVEFDTTKWLNQ